MVPVLTFQTLNFGIRISKRGIFLRFGLRRWYFGALSPAKIQQAPVKEQGASTALDRGTSELPNDLG